ncbi:MAG: VOC family protein [Patescibacteria group bacterium]
MSPFTGPGGNTVRQIGLIVRDIERSARVYADLFGVAVPPITVTDPPAFSHAEYMGKPTEARAKLAFFQLGQVSLELIEPIGGPSTWRDFLESKGEGLHHVAFEVQGMDGVLADMAARGYPLIQRGDYTGGRYAYLDTQDALGAILELLENYKT